MLDRAEFGLLLKGDPSYAEASEQEIDARFKHSDKNSDKMLDYAGKL